MQKLDAEQSDNFSKIMQLLNVKLTSFGGILTEVVWPEKVLS